MFCLINLSIEFLLVLFSDIITFILLSLHEYVNIIKNKNHHHICYDYYYVLMSIMFVTIMTPLRIAILIATII
jgi:hypothetical protein